MTKRDPLLYLDDIVENIDHILKYTAGHEREQLFGDEVLQAAIARWTEIIGEAANHVPKSIQRKHSEVDWQMLVTARHLLIHGYFRIDYDRLWDIVTIELPDAAPKVRAIRDALHAKRQTS